MAATLNGAIITTSIVECQLTIGTISVSRQQYTTH